jgi:hypothetical protein
LQRQSSPSPSGQPDTGVVWVTTKSILVGGVAMATAAPLGLRWCSRALLLDEAGVPCFVRL